jgi:putative molybdopterin biosynthesis protein
LRRTDEILVQNGNPKNISGVQGLAAPGLKIANRPLSTGTRLLLDRELRKIGINGDTIEGYHRELNRHIDVGLEVLSGRADAGPGIRAIAALLGIGFVPIRWERYDLMIAKDRFFDEGVQQFIGLLHEDTFRSLLGEAYGYDLSTSGKMVYPMGEALDKTTPNPSKGEEDTK